MSWWDTWSLSTGFARGQLGMVLFSGDDAEKRLAALSGGESARLVLCSLMIRQPNVLVLDEPTNHLDLEAIEALVEGLRAHPGTLVLVSHDRWFVSRRRPSGCGHGGAESARGGGWGQRRGRGMSAWQRRRLEERAEELAARVEAAEARVAEIDAVFADPAFYEGSSPDEVRSLERERAERVEEAAALTGEWEGVAGRL